MGSRVDLFARIRRDARVEGLGIRALARKHGVGRDTVRTALSRADPPPRKTPARVAPRLGPFKGATDEMLLQDLGAPRKQRHTATRIVARLVDEHGATDLSYSTVRDYVRVRRAQIDVEAGRRLEVFVPQEHAPGEEAEVDFGEVWVVLAGVKTKCHLFTFRLSHSGKSVHRVYSTQSQEAFLEGHVDAFEELGGIPTRHIRYDNLSSAVQKVVYGQGRNRVENERWVLFRSHYGFDAVGAVSADVVAVEARLHAGSVAVRQPAAPQRGPEQRVVSLTQRRLADPAAVIAGLPPDRRPLPNLAQYDQLLTRRAIGSGADERERTSGS